MYEIVTYEQRYINSVDSTVQVHFKLPAEDWAKLEKDLERRLSELKEANPEYSQEEKDMDVNDISLICGVISIIFGIATIISRHRH